MDNNLILEQILKNQKRLNRRFGAVMLAVCAYILYSMRKAEKVKENAK